MVNLSSVKASVNPSFNISEQQARENSQNPASNGISVFTIENGQRTLINYSTGMPPRSPAHLVMKEELPPTYDDALKMQLVKPENPSSTLPRRDNAIL